MRLFGAGERAGSPYAERDAFWTVPNVLTMVRFCGVPLFIWLIVRHDYGAAVVVLVVLGGTDWVDGYIARRFNQASRIGRVMDPAADRLALLAAAVTLVVAGLAPLWLAAALIIPDIVLLVTSLLLFHGHPDLPVSRLGKLRVALLLVGTPLLLLAHVRGMPLDSLRAVALFLLVLGCIGHWIASARYLRAMFVKHRGSVGPGEGTVA